jgi:hypothetical protein
MGNNRAARIEEEEQRRQEKMKRNASGRKGEAHAVFCEKIPHITPYSEASSESTWKSRVLGKKSFSFLFELMFEKMG